MFSVANWGPQTVGDGLPDVPLEQGFMRAVEDASPYRLVRRRNFVNIIFQEKPCKKH